MFPTINTLDPQFRSEISWICERTRRVKTIKLYQLAILQFLLSTLLWSVPEWVSERKPSFLLCARWRPTELSVTARAADDCNKKILKATRNEPKATLLRSVSHQLPFERPIDPIKSNTKKMRSLSRNVSASNPIRIRHRSMSSKSFSLITGSAHTPQN